jgi:hypothetical protein
MEEIADRLSLARRTVHRKIHFLMKASPAEVRP